MKRVGIFFLACTVLGLSAVACQRDKGVMAGNDSGDYRPRAAEPPTQTPASTDLSGELMRVDLRAKTFAIRVASGMEQTFKFDGKTALSGLPQVPERGAANAMANLAGKEGSELTVKWEDDDGAKKATLVVVTEVSTVAATTNHHKR